MEKEKINIWKIIGIILIIVLIVENLFLWWGISMVNQEEEDTKQCYYDVCEEYPDAELTEGVCFCYDYDLIGDLVIVKTEIIN